jgi:hypothetical protein
LRENVQYIKKPVSQYSASPFFLSDGMIFQTKDRERGIMLEGGECLKENIEQADEKKFFKNIGL